MSASKANEIPTQKGFQRVSISLVFETLSGLQSKIYKTSIFSTNVTKQLVDVK